MPALGSFATLFFDMTRNPGSWSNDPDNASKILQGLAPPGNECWATSPQSRVCDVETVTRRAEVMELSEQPTSGGPPEQFPSLLWRQSLIASVLSPNALQPLFINTDPTRPSRWSREIGTWHGIAVKRQVSLA